ncbi:hypothetical protein [Pseudonocardia sp. NPDC049635]|uniref:hypothetical protein n=1 Tax=Pseudonocardia sp. NPDC049635 TaxID=3155506 RepID=UPI0033CB128F
MTGVGEQSAALRRLVERLDDTADVLVAVRRALAAAWDDPAGREWADRLDLVRRATDRLAAAASAEREQLDAAPDPAAPDPAASGPAGPGPAWPTATPPPPTGTRTTDRRGVVTPLLPPLDPHPDR